MTESDFIIDVAPHYNRVGYRYIIAEKKSAQGYFYYIKVCIYFNLDGQITKEKMDSNFFKTFSPVLKKLRKRFPPQFKIFRALGVNIDKAVKEYLLNDK